MNEAPAIDVHIVQGNETLAAWANPERSALAPAVTNAIFAATGVRLRKLPIVPSKLRARAPLAGG
jgi:CO/xanthine dehydrogenase Mo-binding subunit